MIICSLLFLAFLLFFPSIAVSGSRYGASLWLFELLPTLLPFFIAVRLFRFCLPRAADKKAFLLIGLLCGYPVGASLVTEQYRRQLLTKEEAYFYLGFVNNPSPMFVMAYCADRLLHLSSYKAVLLFGLLVLSSLAGSLLFYLCYHTAKKFHSPSPAPSLHPANSPGSMNEVKMSPSEVLDNIILESFQVMVTVGGYVILFSILGQLFHTIFAGDSVISILGCGLLEISSGVSYLGDALMPTLYKRALMLAILTFGGLSAAFQTSSIITKTGLSLIPYLLNKALNSLIAGITALLLFRIF